MPDPTVVEPRPEMPDAAVSRKDHTLTHSDPARQMVWDFVSASPLRSLWDLQGAPLTTILKRTWTAFNDDNLVSRAAELGFYFVFALFPMLISASALVGLVARSANELYGKLLAYLSVVVPHDAFGLVLQTFNQTAAQSTPGKITFGFVAAIWSASVGFSAIQDTLNTVYKVKETRPYWKARGQAMLVTVPLSLIVTLTLGLLALLFAVIYYFAPDIKNKLWRWLTPGSAIGIGCWFVASIGLRVYLYYFNSYALTYGSLGAVIILLTWFYLTGLMLLLGAEINSQIEACAAERRLRGAGAIASGVAATPTSSPVVG